MACYQSFMAVFLPSWTSPWRFRRIVSMSKSGVGDVWMRATPCVTIWGGKPRRNTSPRCIWRDELPVLSRKHTSSRLSTERHLVSSVTQVVASTRDFLEGSLSLYHRFELYRRVNNLRHRHMLYSKIHRVSCVCSGPGNGPGACVVCFLTGKGQNIAWSPKVEPESGRKLTARCVTGRFPVAQRLLMLDFLHRKDS